MPDLQLPVTPEEYEAAGSKFASAGAHLSKISEMPDWDTPGVSIKFPFVIIAGDNAGIEGKISTGVKKDGIWKLKEMLGALGIQTVVKNGIPTFDPMECIEKQFLTVWTEEVDSRTPEEGGKGTKYTKPTSALPVGAKVDSLGI